MSALLEVEGLSVQLPVQGGLRPVLTDIGLSIGAGEAVGLVGESGSGKSMTARAVARLLPKGAQTQGAIRFDGDEVTALRGGALRAYRTSGVAMVFQDPRAHVNPVRRIGDFMVESLCTNLGVARSEAARRAIAGLADVGIADGARRLEQYPHELSGGLLQRVMIATAMLAEPRLVLADEPTTALDVTTQAEVMAILDELRRERGLALLFITHDLDLAAAVCDRTCVMYAGRMMEVQGSASLHDAPLHPYAAALLQARPPVGARLEQLPTIPGRPVSAFEAPPGCPFAPRCAHAQPICATTEPALVELGGGRSACVRAGELLDTLAGEVAHV
jgi:oligopeptide/dipeptide ABC transporter ATP-binding protein